MSQTTFPAGILAKAEKIQAKNEYLRETFDIPDTEAVIQDYVCRLYRFDSHTEEDASTRDAHSGRVYVTQNYVLFQSSINEQVKFHVPLCRVISCEQWTRLLKSTKLVTEIGEVYYIGLVRHGLSLYHLVHHLWQFEPFYCMLSEKSILNALDLKAADLAVESPRLKSVHHSAKLYEKVDVKSGQRALRTAQEVEAIADHIMQSLEEQGQQIDRIEHEVREAKANIKQAAREVDNVSNIACAAVSALTPDVKGPGALSSDKRKLDVTLPEASIDIPALFKQKALMKHLHKSLLPVLLRYQEKALVLEHSPNKKGKVKTVVVAYDDVARVAVKSRRQVFEIETKGNKSIEVLSSFMQAAVNELVVRTPPGSVAVVFEPLAKKFQFGCMAIRTKMLPSLNVQRSEPSGDGADYSFGRQQVVSNAANVIDKVPEEVAAQLREQDEAINATKEAVDRLDLVADAINAEGKRQTEQLESVNHKADKALKNINKQAYRARKLQ